ncbi:MAG: hypothetical protein ACRCYY_01410 [Trueperaceae bacterium]
MRKFLFLFIFPFTLVLFSLASALEMPVDSEQYYVAQGVFDALEITSEACPQQDDIINFACGQYAGEVDAFKQTLSEYVVLELPGLYPATDWFDNAGGVTRDYRSAAGQYLFAYNPGGFAVIAFIPK